MRFSAFVSVEGSGGRTAASLMGIFDPLRQGRFAWMWLEDRLKALLLQAVAAFLCVNGFWRDRFFVVKKSGPKTGLFTLKLGQSGSENAATGSIFEYSEGGPSKKKNLKK